MGEQWAESVTPSASASQRMYTTYILSPSDKPQPSNWDFPLLFHFSHWSSLYKIHPPLRYFSSEVTFCASSCIQTYLKRLVNSSLHFFGSHLLTSLIQPCFTSTLMQRFSQNLSMISMSQSHTWNFINLLSWPLSPLETTDHYLCKIWSFGFLNKTIIWDFN